MSERLKTTINTDKDLITGASKKGRDVSSEIKSKLEKFLSSTKIPSWKGYDEDAASKTVTTIKKDDNSAENIEKNKFNLKLMLKKISKRGEKP